MKRKKAVKKCDIFSEVYNIDKKELKHLTKKVNTFLSLSENKSIDQLKEFLIEQGLESNTAYKFTGFLLSGKSYLLSSTNNKIFYKDSNVEIFEDEKLKSRAIDVIRYSEKREFVKSLDNPGIQLVDFMGDICVWKDISELPDYNNSYSVRGSILVSGVWDEDEPPPNRDTTMVSYRTGWSYPRIEFCYSTSNRKWPFADKIDKYMNLPHYKYYK